MPATRAIARYVLRTTDAPAAREFYAALLGHHRTPIVPLHEQALARGARPHWLGMIEVDDVDSSLQAFAERGAEQLGPVGTFPDGRKFAVLRDPGGAIIGLTTPAAHDDPDLVMWHQLNSNDPARAVEAYASLFGWRFTHTVTHPEHGAFQHFSWAPAPGSDPAASRSSDLDAGAVVDIRGRADRHPHWLFHLRVSDIDRALAKLHELGGKALGPFELPSGERLLACDDPQGAAFALRG